jgi:putative tryptophan/tyrosine transport system substrate-binding protein
LRSVPQKILIFISPVLWHIHCGEKGAAMNRNLLCLFAVLILASGRPAEAQQPKKVYRIGYLTGVSAPSSAPATNSGAFRQALGVLGYIEGKNIIIEHRSAYGKLDQLPQLAAELVSFGVDIIVASGTPGVLAAKQVTNTIPIVAANADNLVELGVVASLARPGGNVTGLTRVDADFSVKRLEILNETLPKLSRVAVLFYGALGGDQEELQETQAAARTLGVQLQSLQVQDPNQFMGAYAEMTKRRADGLIIFNSAFTSFHRKELLELATKNRLPTVCANAGWIDVGCMMSYGPNTLELHRRAAVFVDKILKGTKPADLPVEQPTKFDFVINLKTVKQIGLTIPPNVLARADKVIK